MKQVVFLALFFFGYVVLGFEISNIEVKDKEKAQIVISGELSPQLPQWGSDKNIVDLSFPKTTLSKELTESSKIELDSPHVLVKRLSAIEEAGKVKIRMVLNGSIEGLKDRIKIIPAEKGVVLSVDYPVQNASALRLLQQEQAPISTAEMRTQKKASTYNPIATVIILFLAFSAVLGFLFVRYTKKQTSLRGTRKYLIEQVSYFPLGTKSGVSLVKVGNEFVLLGVTPQSITTLSHLPKLQTQYEEESGFERGVFQESVAEEMHKMRAA